MANFNTGTSQSTQLIDRNWFLYLFVPSCIPLIAFYVFLGTLIGFRELWHLFRVAPIEVQTTVSLFSFGSIAFYVLEMEAAYQAMGLAPYSSLSKEIAGRFTVLVRYIEHFENYPQRRYGIDSQVIWPRLWLVLPSDVRQVLSEKASTHMLSITYYMMFRKLASFFASSLIGILAYLAFAEPHHMWWLLACVWSIICLIRIEYSFGNWVIGDNAKLMTRFFSIARLILHPQEFLSGLVIAFTTFVLTAAIFYFSEIMKLTPEPDFNTTRVLLCLLETFAFVKLSENMYNRMVFATMSFGQTVQSSIDVFRIKLAESLSRSKVSLDDGEETYWQSTAAFLHSGSELILSGRLKKEEKPAFIRAKAIRDKAQKTTNQKVKAFERLVNFRVIGFNSEKKTIKRILFFNSRIIWYLIVFIPMFFASHWDYVLLMVNKDPELWD